MAHLDDPSTVVPESVMPPYKLLKDNILDGRTIAADLKANKIVGVPYTDDDIANARADLFTQLDEYADDYDGFMARYPGANVRDFDGDPDHVTEMDALIAYLQMLGTLVDFSTYKADSDDNLR